MQILDRLQKRKWLLVALAVSGAFIVSQPVLWPDGLGLKREGSTTTTVEKNEQGKVIKTVETTTPNEGKTLWDWLSLLGVPLSLAGLGFWIQQQEKSRDAATAKAQRERDEDSAKEEALQVYFDRISTLLVDKNLRAIAARIEVPGDENGEPQKPEAVTDEEQELLDASIDVIRARTLSILRRFENDSELKNAVIHFLIEAEILSKLELNLGAANLRRSNLAGAELSGAVLNGVDLCYANLYYTNLTSAQLSGAKLIGADLTGVMLIDADLTYADLTGANLTNADLSGVGLANIKFDESTIWPHPREIAMARIIPERLKKYLDISTNKSKQIDRIDHY